MEKRIDEFFNCILHSDNAPFQCPDEPLREMKEYILTVLKETGAEIHEFTPEGERRFDRECKASIERWDAFLIHAAGLWFVLDLNWSD